MVKKLKDIKKSNKNEEEYYEPEEEEDYEYDPADFETGQYLEEDEYNVEEIVDMKIEKGKKLYFIKWDGYPHSQNTWEPADHLTKVLYMVEQFEEEYAKRKSLDNMPKENPKYFGGDDKLVKTFNDIKKKKGRDLNEEKEIILKKRKMDTQDDFDLKEDERKSSIKEPVREKKSVSKDKKTSVKEKVASPPEEDLIQEITMYKEDLEPKKKKDTKSKTPIKGILDLEDSPTRPEPVVSMQVEKPAKEVKQSVPEIKPTISDPKPKENIQQAPNKEIPKEKPKEIPKDTTKEVPKVIPKEALKEISKEKPKEIPKDTTKEVPKDIPREIPKEAPKEVPKEVPKQVIQMQEEVKEPLEIVFTKAKDLDQALENKESKEMKIAPFNVNKDVGRAPKSAVPVSALKKAREKNVKAAPRKKDKTGAFRNKDRPKAILSIKPGKDGGLVFLVEWHNRSDGFQPENSLVTNEDMKLNDPYFLIDFYEDKLVKINKKEKKRREKEKVAQLNGVPEHEPMHTEEEPAVINNIVEAEVQQPQKPSENVIVNTNKLSEPKSIKSPASIKDFIEELKRNKDSVKSKDANDILEPMDEVESKGNFEESKTQNRMEVESSFKTPVFKAGESEKNKTNSGSKDLFMGPKEVKSASKENPFEDIEKMLVEEPPQQQDKESRKSLNKDRKGNEAEKEGSNSNEEQGNLVSVGS